MRKWRYKRLGTLLFFIEKCGTYKIGDTYYSETAYTVENLPLRFTPVDITNDMN
jgi:hypothetical protein